MTQMGKMEKNSNLSSSKEAIHSGHFMVSEFNDAEVPGEDNVGVPLLEAEDRTEVVVPKVAFDFENACKETNNTYRFGPRCCKSISIDGTLTKLLQCMTIAYSGNKLTSPRWKNFKGLKLRWKDKIRLNNVIWRAWHMQFIKWQSPVVCQFASPIDGDTHNKPEAVVLEGKYWKRRLDTVCAEYKKWRLFHKEKICRITKALSEPNFDFDLFEWGPRSNQSLHSPSSMIIDDDPFCDFNDTLFSCLIPNQPFAFPNPREIARAGIADFIQPGLIQLQPNLDDFVDTFDLFSYRLPALEEQPEDNNIQDIFNPPVPQNNRLNMYTTVESNQENLQYQDNKCLNPSQTSSSYEDNDYPLMDTSLMTTMLESTPRPPPPPPLPQSPNEKLPADSSLGIISEIQQQSLTLNSSSLDLQLDPLGPLVSPQDCLPKQPSAPVTSTYTSPPRGGHTLNSQSSRIRPKPSSAPAQKYVSILPAPQTISNQPQQNSSQIRPTVPTTSAVLIATPQVPLFSETQTPTTKQDVFIMPKGTVRTRSRSMSGPQITTTNNALSNSLGSSSLGMTNSIPQSALLAQLLTSGTYVRPAEKSGDTQSPSTNLSIISTVASPPSTVVLSPIQLTNNNSTSPPLFTISPVETTTSSLSGSKASMVPANELNRSVPTKPFRPKSDSERVQYREHRRVCHINAEQKRRCNIKTGFDLLNTLVPSLMQNPPNKLSKAVVLQKAGEYIVQLKTERAQLQEEADMLRKQIETLNQAINVCQAQLPATGAPVSRQRISKLRDMFDEYVRKRTLQNWKFWIFSVLIQPLLETYNNSVSTASITDLSRTVLTWMEQHCSLVELRPGVLNSLRYLSTSTNILSDPTHIAEEATQAVSKPMQCGR